MSPTSTRALRASSPWASGWIGSVTYTATPFDGAAEFIRRK